MKKTAAAQGVYASVPRGNRGQYVGESQTTEGYIIDKGGQYLMRAGWDPSTSAIGGGLECHGGLLEGLSDDLVRRSVQGHYSTVKIEGLSGLSVALLFSAGDHPKCTSFVPFLAQFYKSVNESGGNRKVEVIYVSLDRDEGVFERSRLAMPWLSLQYNSPLRDRIIKRYRLKVEPPAPNPPGTATIGLPRLLVVGAKGEEMHWLPCDHQSATVLREWDYVSCKWPVMRRPHAVEGQADVMGKGASVQDKRENGSNSQLRHEWPLTLESAAQWPLECQRQVTQKR